MSAIRTRCEPGSLHQSVLRAFFGAVATREVHCAHRQVSEHRHDWPTIILPILGEFEGVSDDCSGPVRSPSAMIHPASGAHAATIGPLGLDAINIMFDPAWLPKDHLVHGLDRHVSCAPGPAIPAAEALKQVWLRQDVDEMSLARATAAFLNLAFAETRDARPPWMGRVEKALDSTSPPRTIDLAKELCLHPAWMAQAFRAATGEGLRERQMRRRVERAAHLLRETDHSLSAIAADAGFYDQSHLSRCTKAMLGRTPSEVRSELRQQSAEPSR